MLFKTAQRQNRGFMDWLRHLALFLFVLMPLFLPAGCNPTGSGSSTGFSAPALIIDSGTTRLSLFINLKKPFTTNIWIKLKSVELFTDGNWVPFLDGPLELDTASIGNGQAYLGRKIILPGHYERIRFNVEKAAIRQNGEMVRLAMNTPLVEILMPAGITIKKEASESLFVVWDVDASLPRPALLTPVMTAAPQAIPLTKDLAYAACPDIDTIYLIRTDKNWVSGSIGVPGRPTYLAIDSVHNRLYVLLEGKTAINVLELTSNATIDTIHIPLPITPTFMTVSPDGLFAYVLDEHLNSLVRMDLTTGMLDADATIGEKPQFALYLQDHEQLAVSSGNSQTIFLVDHELLTVQEEIEVGIAPQGLLLWENLLYIAETGSNTVTLYDLYSRQIIDRRHIGLAPRRIHESNGQIYVANFGDRSISILMAGQTNIAKEIALEHPPLEMASSTIRQWLYIGNGKRGGLSVIDLSANRLIGHIDFGAVPVGVAALQE